MYVTTGASIVGNTTRVAILHQRGILEFVDVKGVLEALRARDVGHVVPLSATSKVAGELEFVIDVGEFDFHLCVSPDGRWCAVGEMRAGGSTGAVSLVDIRSSLD